ncbi:hypothetical protein ACIBL6_14990 [Streptomyces sp. NPDC050400]|uniref:hypothetical protein n=1 Tax=Streptomyces sp. NPDC050400 TaxID=3365610 RepID=UPI0037B9A324
MPSSRTVLNRVTLGLCGLAATAAGAWLALGRTAWRTAVPEGWSALLPHTPLVSSARLASMRGQGWWTPTVMATAVVSALLLAVWGARQLRGQRRRRMPLPPSQGLLRTRAMEDALTGLVMDLDGVAQCGIRVRGRPRTGRLEAVLRVRLRPDSAPSAVLPSLVTIASDTAEALAPYHFRLRVRFTARRHRRPHVH